MDSRSGRLGQFGAGEKHLKAPGHSLLLTQVAFLFSWYQLTQEGTHVLHTSKKVTWEMFVSLFVAAQSRVSRGKLQMWRLQLYGSPMSPEEVQERKR